MFEENREKFRDPEFIVDISEPRMYAYPAPKDTVSTITWAFTANVLNTQKAPRINFFLILYCLNLAYLESF